MFIDFDKDLLDEELSLDSEIDGNEDYDSKITSEDFNNEVMEIYYNFSESYYECALECAIAESRSLISEDEDTYNKADETFVQKIRRIVSETVDILGKKFVSWKNSIVRLIKNFGFFIKNNFSVLKTKISGGTIHVVHSKDRDRKFGSRELALQFIAIKENIDRMADKINSKVIEVVSSNGTNEDDDEDDDKETIISDNVVIDAEGISEVMTPGLFDKITKSFSTGAISSCISRITGYFNRILTSIKNAFTDKEDTSTVRKKINYLMKLAGKLMSLPFKAIATTWRALKGMITKKKEEEKENPPRRLALQAS